MNHPTSSDSSLASTAEVDQVLERLLEDRQIEAIERLIEETSPADLARAISRLDEASRGQIVDLVGAESAADLVQQIPHVQAVQLLGEAQPDHAAAVVDELPSDLQTDLISDLQSDDAADVLSHMQPSEAADVQQLSQYDRLQAGGLMATELLRYPMSWTIEQVVEDLRGGADKYRDYEIQYAYVVDDQDRLQGVLRLRDLLLGDRQRNLRDIMIGNPLSVDVAVKLEELHGLLQEHSFLGIPVTDTAGRLLGVVQRRDVDEAWIEQQDKSFLRRQGIVSGEEIRSLPLWQRSRGRLLWLSLNIVLNLLAAAIISHFESTLAAAIALTAFLPIISDMSGCSGNQAVAVSIRELMLGLVKPGDVGRVWLKEISVGLMNGAAVGILLGVIAWVWKGNLILGAVIGVALTLNTIVAVSIGGVIPLLLRGMGRDPAVASGPLLTTVTDMCGFFLVLSLASSLIEYL